MGLDGYPKSLVSLVVSGRSGADGVLANAVLVHPRLSKRVARCLLERQTGLCVIR
jgi:hypothetical protein